MPPSERPSFHGNCRFPSGKNHERVPPRAEFRFAALRPAGLFSRPSGALQMCRLRRRRLPGPAPAGGPTSCAPKKSAEEGRSRGAHLKKVGAQSSPPLRIPPPLTSSQPRVEGWYRYTQQSSYRKTRSDTRRKTTPVPGVRAPCARARQSRAVFRHPVGAARHANADVPPRTHSQYGSGGSRAEALRPRRGGGRDAVHPSVHPWTGRLRLWPQANRRRRGGQGDLAAGHPYRESGPQGRVREADSSRGRGAERPRAAVARSALRAQPGQAAQAPCGFFPPFLVRTRNGAACRGGTRQTTPLTERQI